MPSAHLTLKEEDVVRLTLEFLQNRSLHISQLSIERETGVINGTYSDDMLFLRQLILDGQWDDVLEFIQPLEVLPEFDMKRFRYIVLQHKYVELICIKSEAAGMLGASLNMDTAVEEVVTVLNEIEKVAPSKEEYSNLCLMLTLPKLSDHLHYKDWNPSNARVRCFRELYPLVEKFLPCTKKVGDGENGTAVSSAKNDRLVQLIIKGILYESCVRYCQAKATGSGETFYQEINFSRILDGGTGFGDADLSLLSWLQSIPHETFSVPFEQRTLHIDIEQLEKPSLETSWTEHMLITPIKPKTFPHSAMPFTRPKSAADVMSRSLLPALDGLPNGLVSNLYCNTNDSSRTKNSDMTFSTGDLDHPTRANTLTKSSLPSFHLRENTTDDKEMNSSVHKLFENENEVFLSGTYNEQQLPSISEVQHSTPKIQASPPHSSSSVSVARSCSNRSINQVSIHVEPESGKKFTPGQTYTPRINDSSKSPGISEKSQPSTISDILAVSFDHVYDQRDLMKEFQRQKQKFQETLIAQERERQELIRQLQYTENKLQVESANRGNVAMNNAATRNVPVGAVASGIPGTPLTRTGSNASVCSLNNASSHPSRGSVEAVAFPNGPALGPCHHPFPAANGSRIPLPSDTRSHNHTNEVDRRYEQPRTSSRQEGDGQSNGSGSHVSEAGSRPRFLPVTALEDGQAVRCAEFHPRGNVYAVGSNSKILRICAYPNLTDLRENHKPYQPKVLFKRMKHHKGSIYCMAWTPDGELMATGSNDKTVKLMRYNADTANLEGQEIELAMHDGTVRDVCFIEDTSNKSSLLISGGAGDCKIYVTDCVTGQPYQAFSGHSGHILSLYNWGGAVFASGSQDKTVRLWDLRARGCVNVITPVTSTLTKQGSAVAAVCVDPSGRLLVSGHEDASCVLYDIRGTRVLQCFKPHSADVRSIRFSPSAYYLLTAGYDNKLVLTDLQGDLTMPLPSVVVAQHQDKVISGRWHPVEFSFVSTSADKTATLWALPPV